EQLPSLGEIALRAHVPVRSREGGHIGLVDELLVDPDNGAITAVSLHEGHIFGRRSVVIPMSAVISIGDDSLTTSLDRSVFDVLAASAPNE
ncbi:MAG: PRC-barrel domain-containing protein, partial [Actinomycetota bacterium]|nr:PRC-barrel domain-containing protein [Actinomycetota bacterium]